MAKSSHRPVGDDADSVTLDAGRVRGLQRRHAELARRLSPENTMKKYPLSFLLFAFLCSAAPAAAVPPGLLISVDGLHPAYVTEADRYGLKVPALRKLMQQGAHARGILGVRLPHKTEPALQLSRLPSQPTSSTGR
jgi:hypothetical protein